MTTDTRHDPLRDPLCQHEFPGTSLCAVEALPGQTRCIDHQDDGQPDALIHHAGAPVMAGGAR